METAAAEPRSRAAFRAAGRMALGRGKLLNTLEMTLEPLVHVVSLWGVAPAVEGRLDAVHMILAVVMFSLTFPSEARLSQPRGRVIVNILIGWAMLAALLGLFGHFSGYLDYFHRETLVTWCWVAPWCQIGAHFALRAAVPALRAFDGPSKCAVLAGMNAPGLELARRLNNDIYSDIRVLGFVDDRKFRGVQAEYPLLGHIDQLP